MLSGFYMIEEFFKSHAGIVIISIVWGLGVATLFKKTCEGPRCKVIEFHGPAMSESKHFWRYAGDQCYRWKPYIAKC
jgi:hypothetical protein